jgi:hypothetical protein
MRTLIFTLAAAFLLLPAELAAQKTFSKTWFEGELITGVEAQDFDVVLVKSTRTRAVVELGEERLERFIHIGRDDEGVVSIDLKFTTRQEKKEFDRLFWNNNVPLKKLTLYLPSVNIIRLSGGVSLVSSDSFEGKNLDILTSGSAIIAGELIVASEQVKVQCSSGSRIAALTLPTTTNLVAMLSGTAKMSVTAPKATYSKLNVSSGGDLHITGAGGQGNWSSSGTAHIDASEFSIRELSLTASSGSEVKAKVAAGGTGLAVTTSETSRVDLTANGVGLAKFTASSGSKITVRGNGDRGEWSASGTASIDGKEFSTKDLSVIAMSGSDVRANVSGNLSTETSGTATVLYRGNPASINNHNDAVKPL